MCITPFASFCQTKPPLWYCWGTIAEPTRRVKCCRYHNQYPHFRTNPDKRLTTKAGADPIALLSHYLALAHASDRAPSPASLLSPYLSRLYTGPDSKGTGGGRQSGIRLCGTDRLEEQLLPLHGVADRRFTDRRPPLRPYERALDCPQV